MDRSEDPNVEAVRKKLFDRSKHAAKKYGVDTTRHDYGEVEWLTELQEELMDAAVYIEALLKSVTHRVEADIRKHKSNSY